ncbi:alpha/beta hydrolase [Streptomyces bauhiniae]|uniref:alpha/beta hydrolase n=1 Tax=Streptomyces bauhiniae TaxID=2340725 RepID=UPI003645E255
MTTATPEGIITGLAQTLAYSIRTPILRRPDEYGMAYEDVRFQATDGTILEGWFIPADSDKLIIANHPMPCNRYGYPGHLPEYANPSVDFEVNFLPDYKNLHDAGYNVLAYDLRNHGRSDSASGGVCGQGLLEYRDVIGSLRYGRERLGIDNSRIGLYSRCAGANSTIVAMSKHPEEFEDVTVPTLVAQVHDDSSTRPEDVQGIYDSLGSEDKELFWIEGTSVRFDGYNYFPENPEQLINWFNGHFA